MYYIDNDRTGDAQRRDCCVKNLQEQEILARYEQADFFERLCIYLQYRDLRRGFIDIDMHDYKKRSIA